MNYVARIQMRACYAEKPRRVTKEQMKQKKRIVMQMQMQVKRI